MRLSYYPLALLALAGGLWSNGVAAQATACPTNQNECVVEWADPDTGEPIINALSATVAADASRPAGRVYKLLRGGFYYNEERVSNSGFDLRVIGQTAEEGAASGENICGPSGNQDCGPAIVQRFRRADNTVDGFMFESAGAGNGGLTLRHLWLMGMDNTGVTANYEPITINSTNSRFVFDHVVFDRNDWHHLGFKQPGNSAYFTNCSFRNLTGPTQIWEGRGVRFEAGADTVMFENNSFINIGSFPFQSEAAPIEVFVFNHNTLVNVGRQFNAGGIWKKAYVANNVLMNPFLQGESPEQYNDPTRVDPYTGIFTVGALPAAYGLERDRRILLANNGWFRAPEIESIYGPLEIRAQPLVNDTTMAFFNRYDGMVIQGNINANPGLTTAPTDAATYDLISTFINQWVTAQPTPWAHIRWDPGRDPNPLANIWPLPENLAYSNAQFQTAGTDGLPLGDLNWYPSAKQTYLGNRAANLQQLFDLAGPPPPPPTGSLQLQAESGTIQGGSVQTAQGETSLFFEASGSIEWTFNVDAAGTYGLDILTDLRGSDPRGQHVVLDGVELRNNEGYGEMYFCTAAVADCTHPISTASGFTTYALRSDHLIAGSLDLAAGSHTLRITPSWGYQAIRSIGVVNGSGTTVDVLTAPEALTVGVTEECEGGGFCASGFQSVLFDAGGSVSWSGNAAGGTASALASLYYVAPSGGSARLLVDGTEVLANIPLPSTSETEAGNVTTEDFVIAPGPHTFTLVVNTGGVNLDYAFINTFGPVGTEEAPLPEGFALGHAYPNPARSTVTIPFEVGRMATVSIEVFDVLGRKVATLVEGPRAAGEDRVLFDTSRLTSGTYLVRFMTPVGVRARPITVVR
jgi:hypothetical protein